VSASRDQGGGVLLELSHELDYARWLVGEPSSVFSLAARVSDLEIDVEDLAEVTIRFRDGAVGHVHLDMVQRSATRGCRVIGTDGTLAWSAHDHRVSWYQARSGDWQDLHPPTTVDRNQMYLDELSHFLDCAGGHSAPRVTGTDGKRALELALAARRSSQLKKVVDL
jgi:predicted dehydrogenase